MGRAANRAQAQTLRDRMTHLGDAAARHHNGHAHLRRFDDHLAGETPGGVENLVGACHTRCRGGTPRRYGKIFLHPHPPGNGVNGIVAAHIFHKHQKFLAAKQSAGVNRAGRFVGALLQADGADDAVKLRLRDAGLRQHDAVDITHQVTKHTALAAARGDYALRRFGFDVGNALARFDGSRTDTPIDGDGFNVLH